MSVLKNDLSRSEYYDVRCNVTSYCIQIICEMRADSQDNFILLIICKNI